MTAPANYGKAPMNRDLAKRLEKLTAQPTAGVALKPLMEQLSVEIADAADRSDASPLERFVAEALTSDDAKTKGLVDKVWVVSLPDARKAIAAITAWNTRAPTDAGGAVSVSREMTPELYAEFGNIDGPWCRGQITPKEVWDTLRDAAALTSAPQVDGRSTWAREQDEQMIAPQAAPDPVAQPSEGVREAVQDILAAVWASGFAGVQTDTGKAADAILASIPVQPSDLEAGMPLPAPPSPANTAGGGE